MSNIKSAPLPCPPPVDDPHRRRLLRAGVALMGAATLVGAGCALTPSNRTTRTTVKSSAEDGVNLAVYESGNQKGRPVIFIHGFAQSHESWSKQMESTALQRELRLIAFDLRGHGDSDKPLSKDAYHDPVRWANDLRSVIRATGADRPCVVAWSYGGRVLNDYLSVFGDGGLGALNYVAATSSAERFGLGRSYALIVPMLADDPETAARGTEVFLKACFEKQPTTAELETMKRFNAKTPVAVRKLLGGRSAPYEPVLRKISVPTLVTHGTEDQISAPAISEYTHNCIPGSTLSIFKGAGHATFFEEAERFNAELITLASRGPL